MSMFTVTQFIEEVKSRPALWKNKYPGSKDRDQVDGLWREVADLFPGNEAEELKKKFKNLRDNYRKELKKLIMYDETSKWVHFDRLDFMRDELRAIKKSSFKLNGVGVIGNIPSDNESMEDTRPMDIRNIKNEKVDERMEDDDDEEDHEEESDDDDDDDEVEETPVSIKLLKSNNLCKASPSSVKPFKFIDIPKESSSRYSDDYHYLMSLLPQMQTFTNVQKFRVRNKIDQIFLAELEKSEHRRTK